MPIAVALGGANLILLGLLARGQAAVDRAPDVLRGRALELVDERGQIRARLDMEPGGDVVFANDATEPGIHLLAKPQGSSLRLADKNGRERLITP